MLYRGTWPIPDLGHGSSMKYFTQALMRTDLCSTLFVTRHGGKPEAEDREPGRRSLNKKKENLNYSSDPGNEDREQKFKPVRI